MTTVAEVKTLIRRRAGLGVSKGDDQKRQSYSRQSSQLISARNDEPPISDDVTRGNTAYRTPDDTRGLAFVGEVNGQRLQDFANTHLSEGEGPGRIPRFWNDRRSGKVGSVTGDAVGDNFFSLGLTGTSAGGTSDAKFLPHQQIPRGSVIARGAARTVDDSANIPAVFVSDPTRR